MSREQTLFIQIILLFISVDGMGDGQGSICQSGFWSFPKRLPVAFVNGFSVRSVYRSVARLKIDLLVGKLHSTCKYETLPFKTKETATFRGCNFEQKRGKNNRGWVLCLTLSLPAVFPVKICDYQQCWFQPSLLFFLLTPSVCRLCVMTVFLHFWGTGMFRHIT